MNAFTAITPAAPDLATAWFRDVIAAERDALSAFLHGSLDTVPEAVALLARQERPIIFIGVGKSGHVAAKLAATLGNELKSV